MSDILIELRDIEKRFAGVRALDQVSLAVRRGQIHCLAGENGSGKSTIIKIMSGVYGPDAGQILVDGVPVARLDPIAAIRHGIEVIYQDFSLFGNLTVAENLALGHELREKRRLVDWRAVRALARRAIDRLGVEIDLAADLETLPTSGKQLVAIARALMSDPRLLIMDEPTTALTRREVETLFRVVREIQRQGIAVLFVSHKMREMLEISEWLTVIRNGRKVAEGETGRFDEASITRHMTGQDLSGEPYRWRPAADGKPPRLDVRGLILPGGTGGTDFRLDAGEIVGLAGLLGSGRTELALALFGMAPGHRGLVLIDGVPVRLSTVQEAIACGIAYVPEDRLTEGLFLAQSIERNVLAAAYDRVTRGLVLDRTQARALAAKTVAAMQIATPSLDKPVGQLSGGNAQRVVIGRWLLTDAKVLVLNGPTVGVDVGSKAEIHRKLRELAQTRGLAVLMISDDLPELAQNCNRILLMHRGRLVGEVAGGETSEATVSDMLRQLS
jgi:simple sugar transport system ATP-binding protein